MKTIQLTQGKVAVVDDEDFKYLSQHKWCVGNFSGYFYAMRGVQKNNVQKTVLMHRVIMGDKKGFQVDHINHNTLDDRRSNLRHVTMSQNQHNQVHNPARGTKYKGVHESECKSGKRFTAHITHKGKTVHIGVYHTPEEAARAYNKEAIKIRGEFSCLNKI